MQQIQSSNQKREPEKRPLYFRAVSVIEALPRIPLQAPSGTKSVFCTGYVDNLGFLPVEFVPSEMKFYTKYSGSRRQCKVMYWLAAMDADQLIEMIMADVNRKAKQEQLREEAEKEFDDRVSKSTEENKEANGKEDWHTGILFLHG